MPAQTTYLEPGVMTAPGDCQPLLADLPRGVAARLRVPATVYNAVLNRTEPVMP